jgi:hypothetical protein
MHEQRTQRLEGSPTASRLAPHAAGLVPVRDRRSPGRQRSRRQPVGQARLRGRTGSPPPLTPAGGPLPVDHRTAGPCARALAPWSRSLRLSRAGLDLWPDRRRQLCGIRYLIASSPCGALVQGDPLEPAKTRPPRQAARRSGHCPVAQRDVARHQKKAQAQGHSLFCIDESGFSITPLYAGRGGK